jgi:hypothetical protein
MMNNVQNHNIYTYSAINSATNTLNKCVLAFFYILFLLSFLSFCLCLLLFMLFTSVVMSVAKPG